MRASDAARARATRLMRERCAAGYLSLQTFEYRVEQVLAARTQAELDALVADLPRPGLRRFTARARPDRRFRRRGGSAELPLPGPGNPSVVVGRAPACDVRLLDDSVSRLHAEVWRTADGGWWIADLGSTNGVQVNGRRVREAALRPGDRVALGERTLVARA